jgi:hypothetical protein
MESEGRDECALADEGVEWRLRSTRERDADDGERGRERERESRLPWLSV